MIHANCAADRKRMKELFGSPSNFYDLSPMALKEAKRMYRLMRKAGISEWEARYLIWNLVFSVAIQKPKMNTEYKKEKNNV